MMISFLIIYYLNPSSLLNSMIFSTRDSFRTQNIATKAFNKITKGAYIILIDLVFFFFNRTAIK
jgi:hypothetical protein